MNGILFIIIGILVFLVLTFVKRTNQKAEKSMDENNFVLRQPKIFFVIGVICAVFFCSLIVLMCIVSNDSAEWWVFLIFSSCAILGFYIIFYCVKWELKIEGNQIIYTPFIGKKNSFAVSDIKKAKLKNEQKIIAYDVNNKKLFAVEFTCNGFNVLVSRLKKEQIPFEE